MSEEDPTLAPLEQDNKDDGVIMMLLTQPSIQRPWSVDEIAREVGGPERAEAALKRLYGVGLVHRMGWFVWASRAAIHADEVAY